MKIALKNRVSIPGIELNGAALNDRIKNYKVHNKMVPWLATLISVLVPVQHSMQHARVTIEDGEFEQPTLM